MTWKVRLMTILIVEDDHDIGALLQRAFSAEGYKVALAQDGESALRLASETPALNAIILDIMLPDRSGLEVCRALRNAGQQAPRSEERREGKGRDRSGQGASPEDN